MLFKKAIVFTDLHVGKSSNSDIHNQDCLNFVKWVAETGKKENCDMCLFLGDFHHNRSTMNLKTMSYANKVLEILNTAFPKTMMIMGNHDLHYKEKRDVHSIEWGKHLPNIEIVNDFIERDDTVFIPWLIGDEYKTLANIRAKYAFGHLELPTFMMNAQISMPDHGEININYLKNFEKVFTGHFHKRQKSGNVYYIGNAFPHNFSDTGDDDRGVMILEWGVEPEFRAWPAAPKYRNYQLSNVLANPFDLIDDKTYAKINVDVDLNYEEINFMKSLLETELNAREITMISPKIIDLQYDDTAEINFESVDTIVVGHLQTIESNTIDKKYLIELYGQI